MQLVSFHLMPYRPLDLAEAAKHRSPWVVLPNRLYDPIEKATSQPRQFAATIAVRVGDASPCTSVRGRGQRLRETQRQHDTIADRI